MSSADVVVEVLRDLAGDARSLADGIERGTLWPGQAHDKVRELRKQLDTLERIVAPPRPIGHRGRW